MMVKQKQDIEFNIYRIIGPLRTFRFQGRRYNYFYHRYNATWMNERAVEVPIIWEIVRKHQGEKILEVGNVLSHYFSVNHDILDKYEKAPGVINQDVMHFQPACKYDLIVSLSCLEHVGWDESPRDSTKILHAIENLGNLLAPQGKMVVTLPLGYNLEMDKFLRQGKIRFSKQYYLKRISGRSNRWKEVDWEDICDAKYNHPFLGANGVVVGIIEEE